jgi:hypothetical protein
MAAVITICERSLPHPDWAPLRELPYNRMAPLRNWICGTFQEEPPAVPLAGLWFGLFNPIRGGKATADIRLGGSTRFTDDGELEWAYGLGYRPPTSARSAILRSIYSIAYSDQPKRLGNAAEWSLCLAYSVFAVQRLISEIEPALILKDSDSVGVAVGFDSGDFLLVGRLLPNGWVPIGSHPDTKPNTTPDKLGT